MPPKTDGKRIKVEELPPDVACSLMEWLIKDYSEYNGPVSGGSKTEHGTVKQRFWQKWAEQLESMGHSRSAEQVKKKINGELKVVRERLSKEKIEAMKTGGGVKGFFPKLSESRQLLYDFMSSSDTVTTFGGLEAEEEPVSKKMRSMETVEELDVMDDDEEEQEQKNDALIEDKRMTPSATISTPFRARIKGVSARPALQDVSELRRELLKVELETARIKQSATIQQHDNSLKDKERLDLQVENEKLKRELLLNECRIKGIELLEEMNPYD